MWLASNAKPRSHTNSCFEATRLAGCRAARRQYGLLEKKKDYKERAEDFHRKEDTLRRLRRKAEERNPDEFYFAMESARTRGGVHVKRRAVKACCKVVLALASSGQLQGLGLTSSAGVQFYRSK